MAPSDVFFPWTIISIRDTLGECVLPHRLLQAKARQKEEKKKRKKRRKKKKKKGLDKCDDFWVCRELRDVSCGHSF